ncbi:MAG: restriction endonuclease [Acidimicrobiales bacterium]
MKALLVGAGVLPETFDRYADESKFKIARHILSDLDAMGDDGWLIQRRIISELCALRQIPDTSVPSRDEALDALRNLKELALAHQLATDEARSASEQRGAQAKAKQAALLARQEKVRQLRADFYAMAASKDSTQERGYGLEDLLADLFELNEITYRRPYRTATEQIDGHFTFKGFDYLVEARWRADQPTAGDLGAFKSKIDNKLASTRGVFVSIVGFRPEVVLAATQGTTSNIVLIDGEDLTLILEGHVSLSDGLDLKVQKAAQEGILFFPLRERFS